MPLYETPLVLLPPVRPLRVRLPLCLNPFFPGTREVFQAVPGRLAGIGGAPSLLCCTSILCLCVMLSRHWLHCLQIQRHGDMVADSENGQMVRNLSSAYFVDIRCLCSSHCMKSTSVWFLFNDFWCSFQFGLISHIIIRVCFSHFLRSE